MKTYTLTSKIQVDEEHIQKARKWAKRRNYDYKKDVAQLVFDYLTDGNDMQIIFVEIEKDSSLAR